MPPPQASFALALGGGGARGLAHIPVLEAIDALGVRPAAIAGSSMGAAVAALYAAGMSGKDIRRFAIARLHDRGEVWRRLMRARVGTWSDLIQRGLGNPVLLDAEKLVGEFLGEALPPRFEDLRLPLTIAATDLYGRAAHSFSAGPLLPALAASMAIPGLLRPVEIDGHVFVDGAAANPLPFDVLTGKADVVVAVDTATGPAAPRGIPDPWDALFSTIQLMGQAITAAKLRDRAPDLIFRPNVATFRLLDFLSVSSILRVADAIRPEVETRLAARLRGWPADGRPKSGPPFRPE